MHSVWIPVELRRSPWFFVRLADISDIITARGTRKLFVRSGSIFKCERKFKYRSKFKRSASQKYEYYATNRRIDYAYYRIPLPNIFVQNPGRSLKSAIRIDYWILIEWSWSINPCLGHVGFRSINRFIDGFDIDSIIRVLVRGHRPQVFFLSTQVSILTMTSELNLLMVGMSAF